MIEYSHLTRLSIAFKWDGSVIPPALFYSLPSCCLTLALLTLREHEPNVVVIPFLEQASVGKVWAMTTAATFMVLAFRMRSSYSRFMEGASLLLQMQGEWFESASCLVSFSMGAKEDQPKGVVNFRHSLVRLMSLLHGSALEAIKRDCQVSYNVVDLEGLDPRFLKQLRHSKNHYGFDVVEMILHSIQNLMTDNFQNGVLCVDAPILSRVFQTLSRGMVNYINAKKISAIAFPFPFVQMCWVAVLFHAVFTPIVVSGSFDDKVFAVVITALPLIGMLSAAFAAEEIEMPYGDDVNDIPLGKFQAKFNMAMMMLLKESSDHIPGTHEETIRDWTTLYQKSIQNSDSDECSKSYFWTRTSTRQSCQENREQFATQPCRSLDFWAEARESKEKENQENENIQEPAEGNEPKEARESKEKENQEKENIQEPAEGNEPKEADSPHPKRKPQHSPKPRGGRGHEHTEERAQKPSNDTEGSVGNSCDSSHFSLLQKEYPDETQLDSKTTSSEKRLLQASETKATEEFDVVKVPTFESLKTQLSGRAEQEARGNNPWKQGKDWVVPLATAVAVGVPTYPPRALQCVVRHESADSSRSHPATSTRPAEDWKM